MLLLKQRFPAMSLPVCTHLLRPVSGLQVPWEQVPDLVAGRRVLLRHGSAYVHKREMGSLVVSHFRKQLGLALALTARRWASQLAAEEADRLTPIVEALSMRCKRPAYVMPRMTAEGLLSLASYHTSYSIVKQSLPLCNNTACLLSRYLGPDFSGEENGPKDSVTYSQLPALAQQSFPLCMLVSFEAWLGDQSL